MQSLRNLVALLVGMSIGMLLALSMDEIGRAHV
jgi:hypothetical protein